jgi:hypothetical protein
MYLFKDALDVEWQLRHRPQTEWLEISPAFNEYYPDSQRMNLYDITLDKKSIQELIVRLQFFVEHDRLPREKPSWAPPPDDWKPFDFEVIDPVEPGDPTTIVLKPTGPFTFPDRPAVPKAVTFSNPPGPMSEDKEDFEEDDEEDYYDDSSLGTMCGDLDREESSFVSPPEKLLYIVNASKEERFNQTQDFVVGIYDDKDVAECAMDNYQYDLEQEGHDVSLFTFSIEEAPLNSSAEVPSRASDDSSGYSFPTG